MNKELKKYDKDKEKSRGYNDCKKTKRIGRRKNNNENSKRRMRKRSEKKSKALHKQTGLGSEILYQSTKVLVWLTNRCRKFFKDEKKC